MRVDISKIYIGIRNCINVSPLHTLFNLTHKYNVNQSILILVFVKLYQLNIEIL